MNLKKIVAVFTISMLIFSPVFASGAKKPAHGGAKPAHGAKPAEGAAAVENTGPAVFPKGIHSLKVYVKENVGGKWVYQMYAKVYLAAANGKYLEKQTLREKPGSDRYFAYFDKISSETYFVSCRENYMGFNFEHAWDRVRVDVMATSELLLDDSNGVKSADIVQIRKLPVSRVLDIERITDPAAQIFPASAVFFLKATAEAKEKPKTTTAVKNKQAKLAVPVKFVSKAKQKAKAASVKKKIRKVNKPAIERKIKAKTKAKALSKAKTKASIKKPNKAKKTGKVKAAVIKKLNVPKLTQEQMKELLLKKGLLGVPMEEEQPKQ